MNTTVYAMGTTDSPYNKFKCQGFFIGDEKHLFDSFGIYPDYALKFSLEVDCWLKIYSVPKEELEKFYNNYGSGDETNLLCYLVVFPENLTNVLQAEIESPSLGNLVTDIISIQDRGVEIATGHVKRYLQALNNLVIGHKFSLQQSMGSISISIAPPIMDYNEDESDYNKYDSVIPSDEHIEYVSFGKNMPAMWHIMKQIFAIVEYVDEKFYSDIGIVE